MNNKQIEFIERLTGLVDLELVKNKNGMLVLRFARDKHQYAATKIAKCAEWIPNSDVTSYSDFKIGKALTLRIDYFCEGFFNHGHASITLIDHSYVKPRNQWLQWLINLFTNKELA